MQRKYEHIFLKKWPMDDSKKKPFCMIYAQYIWPTLYTPRLVLYDIFLIIINYVIFVDVNPFQAL
jgi:hypothetical protein